MNVAGAFLWGFLATLVLTGLTAAAVAVGLSRMSLPFILGTMLTPNRNRAPLYGLLLHLLNGWAFAFVYALAFEMWSRAEWWSGAALGLLHGLIVLTVILPVLPGIHPRMASEHHGPEPTRALDDIDPASGIEVHVHRLVETLGQRVPRERGALDPHGELHDAAQRLEVAEGDLRRVRRGFGRPVLAVGVVFSPTPQRRTAQ